ncbi:MAG: hypothetical protein ACOYEV_19630 [Candidatus Nanopelagicales bacterium]
MKSETYKGTISQAYGQTLSKSIEFNGSYDAFENIEEVKAKNEFPSDDEIVSFVNARNKANARQKSMTAALDAAGIQKPTLENDADLRLKTMVKTLVASGKSQEEAESLAKTLLG